jgi:hypothetical protein
VHLDIATAKGRQFELGRVERHGRHAQAEPPLQAVICSAGEHDGARGHCRSTVELNPHSAIEFFDVAYALPRVYPYSCICRFRRHRQVKPATIDHVGFDRRGRIGNLKARRRYELGRRKRVQDQRARKVEFAECILGEHACTVDRLSDLVVLFEQSYVETGLGKEGCRTKTTRPASNDRNVDHVMCERHYRGLKLPYPHFPSAAERDPERHGYEKQIQTERRVANVDGIEPEFARARCVARRIDL